jgi:LysM repeat protein
MRERLTRAFWSTATIAAVGLFSPAALAQDDSSAPPGSVTVPSEGGGKVVVTPGQTSVTNYNTPQGTDNDYLPSSSRPLSDTSKGDGFDMNRGSGGEGTVKGSKGSAAIIGHGGAMRVPSYHTVKRGDTLWDLSGRYYGNSWNWPKIWSYNPQVSNPHWIYPGDQLRMKRAGDIRDSASLTGTGGSGGGLVDSHSAVPRDTIFLRSSGYIDDPKKQNWGELVGSREDQMLLSEGNHVYLQMKKNKDVKAGQVLTVYQPVRKPAKVKGSRNPPGQIIAIKGSVRIDQYNPKTHVARGELVESTDTIERGALIGDVGRRFYVVPPKPARVNRWARILTSVYPHEFMAQNQVVFIDRGTEDGLSAGNRLFVVAKGDIWRDSLKTAARSARDRLRMDVPDRVPVETTPLKGNEKAFPEEIIGEIRILKAAKYSSVALVTVSHRELQPGDRAVTRKGM